MLSKHLILNELNKPAPPRSEDYGVDWCRVKQLSMGIKLFVEKLTGDKTMGMTQNVEMMFENTKRIKVTNVKYTEDMVGLVFQAGRYVALIIPDAENKVGMMFVDFKKNRTAALAFASKFSKEHQSIIMKNFDEVCKNYEKNYNLVELVEDENFTPDPSAN